VIAVDSSVWIDHLRGNSTPQNDRVTRMLHMGVDVALTDVVYMELMKGVRTAADLARAKLLIGQTTILRLVSLADFDFAAELYRRARSGGRMVRNVSDCMIAAVCIREGVPLLHDDADFDRIADVSELQVA
jgi:predicted nucleic acid-binding protein